MFWFGAVVWVFSPGVVLRRRGPLPFSSVALRHSRSGPLVSWFDVVLLSLFSGSSSSPRLGPVLRCRGPLSWSGAVVLASSWCRRSVSRPGPVLCRHGPASWFGSLSWCCSTILWFPGVVVGVVVVRGQRAVLGMVSGVVRM